VGQGGFTTQNIARCQTTARAAHWSTTGGVDIAGPPIPVLVWKR
jgi:hypothetical protein